MPRDTNLKETGKFSIKGCLHFEQKPPNENILFKIFNEMKKEERNQAKILC